MDQVFCQSCGMPISDPELWGTEAGGELSADYCKYCYEKGAFTGDMTMDQMIEFCVPHVVGSMGGMNEDEAREMMRGFFPRLKRWAEK